MRSWSKRKYCLWLILFVVLMIIVFNASNWYIYSRIKFYLTWQLGERLANIAGAIAFGLDAEKILKVEEDQRAYKEIKNLLGNVKEDNELADLGTIFLDEIGEISPAIQAKLLKVLEEKKFTRVGGVETIEVDTRVIAATNKDLEQNVKVGKFREDLHFRLNVFPIWIPPLRERREDVTLLVEYFLIKYHYGRRKLPAVLMDQLINYAWPRNVRELKNILERAMILSDGKDVEAQHVGIKPGLLGAEALPTQRQEMKTPPEASGLSLEEMEKEMIVEALKRSKGNKTEPAKALHITKRMLYSRMKKLQPIVIQKTRT